MICARLTVCVGLLQANLADFTGLKTASALRLGRKEEQTLGSRVTAQSYTVRAEPCVVTM